MNACHTSKHILLSQIYTHQLISRQACRLSNVFAAAKHIQCCSVDEDIRSEMSVTISSLSWSGPAGILSAGTSTGRAAFWKHEQSNSAIGSSSNAHHMDADPSVHWLPQRGVAVAGRVNDVVWGHDDRCTLCVYLLCCLSVLVACTSHSVACRSGGPTGALHGVGWPWPPDIVQHASGQGPWDLSLIWLNCQGEFWAQLGITSSFSV